MSETTSNKQAGIRTSNPCHRGAKSKFLMQSILHYHVFLPCSAGATGRTLINVSSFFTVFLVHDALATAQQSITPKGIKRSRNSW